MGVSGQCMCHGSYGSSEVACICLFSIQLSLVHGRIPSVLFTDKVLQAGALRAPPD